MEVKVEYDSWNNDLTWAKARYSRSKGAEIIKIEFETEAFKATKLMSVAEAEELVKELSDYIRWIKEA